MLNGDYQATTALVTAPIMMHTKDETVNNPALMNHFFRWRAWTYAYFSRTDVPIPSNGSFALIIRGTTQATLISIGAGRNDTVRADITSQLAKHVVLAIRDSASILSSDTNSNRRDQLSAEMEAENPTKQRVWVSPVTGYSQYCRFRPIRVVKINARKL